ERAGCGIHARHYGCERATDLRGVDAFGELMAERHLGQVMECAVVIGERTTDGGEGAFGADEALQNGGVADGAGFDWRAHRFPAAGGFYGVEDVEEQGMNDEAVAVVKVEGRTVAVKAVAFVPLLDLTQGGVDAHSVPGQAELVEQGFDDGGKKNPVVEAGLDFASFDEGADEVTLRGGVEFGP